jgi:hypothetical protein
LATWRNHRASWQHGATIGPLGNTRSNLGDYYCGSSGAHGANIRPLAGTRSNLVSTSILLGCCYVVVVASVVASVVAPVVASVRLCVVQRRAPDVHRFVTLKRALVSVWRGANTSCLNSTFAIMFGVTSQACVTCRVSAFPDKLMFCDWCDRVGCPCHLYLLRMELIVVPSCCPLSLSGTLCTH